MSDDLTKLIAKVASMEAELAGYRSASKEPKFDGRAFASAMTRDAKGTLTRHGVNYDHVSKVILAQAFADAGLPVPPELSAVAAVGPQAALTQELASELQALRQRVDGHEKVTRNQTVRESMKLIAEDKTKNPRLATAYAADPSLFDDDIQRHEGSAAELAEALEKRLERQAKALGAPPIAQSKVDANEANAQVKQGTAQTSGAPAGDPPSTQQRGKTKGFTEDDKAALRDEIVRNAERGVYDNPSHTYRQT